MPHLYLPNDHTDADLVLATDVAAAISSADLYVTWTLDSGAGSPEVEAVVSEEQAVATPSPPHPFAELLVALMQGVAAVWTHLTGPPAQRLPQPLPAESRSRPAGEPSY